MAPKLEIFYDYVCPYCYKGLQELDALLEEFPQTEADWRPIEVHPRPEKAAVHSDLAIRMAYQLARHGLDVSAYNKLVYKAHFQQGRRIDDRDLLRSLALSCGLEADKAEEVLEGDAFGQDLTAYNHYVWTELALEAVPSYRRGDSTALSLPGQPVTREILRSLLEKG